MGSKDFPTDVVREWSTSHAYRAKTNILLPMIVLKIIALEDTNPQL